MCPIFKEYLLFYDDADYETLISKNILKTSRLTLLVAIRDYYVHTVTACMLTYFFFDFDARAFDQ